MTQRARVPGGEIYRGKCDRCCKTLQLDSPDGLCAPCLRREISEITDLHDREVARLYGIIRQHAPQHLPGRKTDPGNALYDRG